MVGSSKILTVSYGTFSCTLEGFDESFETMKAIAEYFRDLAADDRYFGAEPPTPDADMLARIAEREIARRVEAHEHEGRIVLRAKDNTTTGKVLAAALGTAPAEAPVHEAGAVAKPAPEQEKEAAPAEDTALPMSATPEAAYEPEPKEEPTPEMEAAHEDEATPEAAAATGMEAALPEESAPDMEAAPEEEETPEEAFAPGVDATPEAEPSAEREAASEAAVEVETAPEEESDFASAALDISDSPDVQYATDEAAALGALEPEGLEREEETPAPEAADEEATPPFVQEAEDVSPAPLAAETDDLSARLDLIRSVVGASDTYDEDEHAQDFADTAAAEPLAWGEADEAEEREDDASQPGSAESEFAQAEADEDAGPADEDDDQAAQKERVFQDTLAALLADATPLNGAADETVDIGAEETSEAATAEADERRSARVVKVSRADVEAVREEGLLDTSDEAGEDTVNIFEDEADALSPEDEAELQRELASLDAELDDENVPEGMAGADDDAEAVADHDEPEQVSEPSAQPRAGKDTEVTRIFEETDSHMAEPGSVRRRNTIQHLRAALAATRAEKEAGADLAKKVDTTPYRGDLDAAVRPRRAMPAPDAPRSARPEEPRPAPLKLVAEQRVDTPRTKVHPRRVATPRAEVVAAQDKGFTEFAEELGATDLPDLLEAAAAYLADVEGLNQFSRPMLMGKLREIDEEGFSREDGLRSFGQLLREGKLQKLAGGRFSVTEDTEYRAAARQRVG